MVDAVAPSLDLDAQAPPAATGIAPVSPAYLRVALAILLGAYVLNFLDRQVVSILAEPIKRDLQLTDWQLGMLTGLAFALFYTILGLPIARLAERWNRPWVIAGSMAVWSGFTLLSGQAANFAQMLLFRMGVGVGEAGCTPAAHSLISDYAPREKRASAISVYSVGAPLGSLIGMAMGGLIADAHGWRVAFMVAGAPGLVLAVVAGLVLREPRRGPVRQAMRQKIEAAPTLAETLKELSGKTTFWLMAGALSLVCFVGYAHIAFTAPFYMRIHGPAVTELAASVGLKAGGFLGVTLGLVGGLSGVFGTLLGGVLADRAARRDVRGYMTIPAAAALLAVPFYGFLYTAATPLAALALGVVPNILINIWTGPVYATAQSMVHPRSRATASAILLLIANFVGLGLGPLGLGFLSDRLSASGLGEAEGLRWAMLSISYLLLISGGLYWLARRTVARDIVS